MKAVPVLGIFAEDTALQQLYLDCFEEEGYLVRFYLVDTSLSEEIYGGSLDMLLVDLTPQESPWAHTFIAHRVLQFHMKHPTLPILLVADRWDFSQNTLRCLLAPIHGLEITKPFDLDMLLMFCQQCLLPSCQTDRVYEESLRFLCG